MTLYELFDDLEALEKMTDAELLVYCKPYLEVTRPEMAVRAGKPGAPARVDPKLLVRVKEMSELGIDLSFLLKAKRK